MPKVSRDIPISELTLRRYEKPYKLEKRELVKKVCLSCGLLQPGDSRDIVVDVLYVLLAAKRNTDELSSEKIRDLVIDLRKTHELPMSGIASSNIRRQIKRLRDIFLVEKIKNNYRITEFDQMSTIFNEKIEQYLLQSVVDRVKDYYRKIDEVF
ncbi:hypothetical protein HOK51_10620 [Candidatus Woesearchaeota archaeon]|jgi:hypothetical protein|nr:hypothetical protein [Candidatus Woesearchaeota archaeon]MBT6520274.1 hypothetical protein [Candidatus Woesearchaeota archaeon]MBT7367294.1 hypothetical protein [Candidatus Woesearchaeota archaeon]